MAEFQPLVMQEVSVLREHYLGSYNDIVITNGTFDVDAFRGNQVSIDADVENSFSEVLQTSLPKT